ncbi:type II secretion system F family protein [Actinomadura rifamycini]|uniref:type II secretion system F family protein n=1 Tax=Actinomadura rifamycini TaxID=31962 RepID=UPI0009FE53FE|nr:type II secretion system F family protein [Actinomadura rifamycini]
MLTALAAVLCAATAVHLRTRRASGRRLARCFRTPRKTGARPNDARPDGARPDGARPDGARPTGVLLRRTAAAAAGVLTVLLFGLPLGPLLTAPAAAAAWYACTRLDGADRARRRARLVADLPVAVDLLAACLRGGTPWQDAVDAVAGAVGGPLGDELDRVSAQIRLGADPAAAWLALTGEPALAPLARAAVRATSHGAALAPSLARLARDQRRTARTAAAARARAAGVRVLAPLGLCFLPAFVLLGVVPAVAGIASTILVPAP